MSGEVAERMVGRGESGENWISWSNIILGAVKTSSEVEVEKEGSKEKVEKGQEVSWKITSLDVQVSLVYVEFVTFLV